ncbi:hypothetical protein [Anaeromicropila populeti]|uniref:Uncharacterized protein n=1 Tax=Anaeromicropila populeti TaxID=37658 RepID=A0A1I6HTT9_9FIRM|nr:hypothetical protein [Anaeromicropila populeti]SFR57818.1 hypothetical protein SAMN05661086_00282 [Anaeromicropila populeti]
MDYRTRNSGFKKKKYLIFLFCFVCIIGIVCIAWNLHNHIEKNKQEVIQTGKYFEILKLSKKDHYKCKAFNEDGELIYSEEIQTIVWPTATMQYNAVDFHHGAGTGTYLDKFVDYQQNLKSDWFQNVRAIGKDHVAYVRWEGKEVENIKTVLVVAKKYEQNTEKKYSFPHILNEWDIDICEFRNNETELYIHYIDKDTKETEEKTIKLSEFE